MRWWATIKPERDAAEGLSEGAACWRTTIKSVIKGGAQHCGVVASLLTVKMREKDRTMDKKDALKVLFQSAELYRDNLEGRNILLICASNSLKSISAIEVLFERTNFMHLTGVKFEDGQRMAPDTFYTLCLQKRLSLDSFVLAEDGTTKMKLSVLPHLFASSNLSANMIGDYHDRRPALITEKLAGNIRGCIGFKFDPQLACYVPNTVLNIDIRDSVTNSQRIIATYCKNKQDTQYSQLVYKAKKIDLTSVRYPEEFSYLQLEQQTEE